MELGGPANASCLRWVADRGARASRRGAKDSLERHARPRDVVTVRRDKLPNRHPEVLKLKLLRSHRVLHFLDQQDWVMCIFRERGFGT